MKHQTVLNSITLIVDTFISQSKSYDSVSVVESMLKWNISHLELIATDVPDLALDVDIAIGDLRRIAKKTIERLTNSGDSARHSAGAPVLISRAGAIVSEGEPGKAGEEAPEEAEPVRLGQGGNQDCQADYFFVNDFCNCDSCRPRHDQLIGIHFSRAWQAAL